MTEILLISLKIWFTGFLLTLFIICVRKDITIKLVDRNRKEFKLTLNQVLFLEVTFNFMAWPMVLLVYLFVKSSDIGD